MARIRWAVTVFGLLLVLVVLAAGREGAQAADHAQIGMTIYKRLLKSTVLIIAPVKRGDRPTMWMGSGTLVDKTNRLLLADVPTNHGNCGGPLVNTRGQMVGVVQGGINNANNLSIFIDAGEAKEQLEKFARQRGIRQVLPKGPAIKVGDAVRVADLLKAVAGPDQQERIKAIAALGEMGTVGYLAVPRLIQTLKDKDVTVRRFAVDALDRIGVGSDDVPALRSLLDHRNEQVRLSALQVLDNMGADASSALPAISKAAGDPDAKVREKAVRAISKMATSNCRGIFMPALVRALKDSDESVRLAAAEALPVVPLTAADAPTLAELLKEKDARLRVLAARALRKLGPDGKKAAPALAEALKDKDKRVREAVLEALIYTGADAKDVLPQVVQSIRDPDTNIRRAAIELAGSLGAEAGDAVSALTEALEAPSLRAQALRALSRIGPMADEAAGKLAELLRTDAEHRLEIVLTLKEMHPTTGKGAAAARANLILLLGVVQPTGEGVDLREAMTDTLAAMGTSAVPSLITALRNDRAGARLGAALALGKIGPAATKAIAPLTQHARRDIAPAVKEACAAALDKIREP